MKMTITKVNEMTITTVNEMTIIKADMIGKSISNGLVTVYNWTVKVYASTTNCVIV